MKSDGDGEMIIAEKQYQDAYGNRRQAQASGRWDADASGWSHNTKERDEDIGIIYMYQRWYQPETGTFLSRAPYRPMLEHQYTFASQNPVSRVDPRGEWDFDDPRYKSSAALLAYQNRVDLPISQIIAHMDGCNLLAGIKLIENRIDFLLSSYNRNVSWQQKVVGTGYILAIVGGAAAVSGTKGAVAGGTLGPAGLIVGGILGAMSGAWMVYGGSMNVIHSSDHAINELIFLREELRLKKIDYYDSQSYQDLQDLYLNLDRYWNMTYIEWIEIQTRRQR